LYYCVHLEGGIFVWILKYFDKSVETLKLIDYLWYNSSDK